MSTALAVMLLAHAAVAGAPQRPSALPQGAFAQPIRAQPHNRPPSPPHGAQPIPQNQGSHPAGPVRGGVTFRQPSAQPAPPAQAARPHRRHHEHRGYEPNSYDPYAEDYVPAPAPCDEDFGDCSFISGKEPWDQALGEDQEAPPEGPAAPAWSPNPRPPPPPPPPVDCDGGSADFHVDEGSGEPAIYRWVDGQGEEHFGDEADIPDAARASARPLTGAVITVVPRAGCAGSGAPAN